MKLAKILWVSASILINVTIGIYIWLSSGAPSGEIDRYEYLNANWIAYGYHWRTEFVLMAMIAIAAFYFAVKFKDAGWSIVTIGQMITLAVYPVMLGDYRNTSVEIFTAANQIATVIFLFGSMIFYGGLCWLYCQEKILSKWLKYLSVSLALIVCLAFAGAFLELWTWKQAMKIGPLASVVYLINAYYGMKLK